MVGNLAGFDIETGDLPLHFAGGGPPFCIRGAGMRGVPDVHADGSLGALLIFGGGIELGYRDVLQDITATLSCK